MIDAFVWLPFEFNFLSNTLSRIFHSQLGCLSEPKAVFMNENAFWIARGLFTLFPLSLLLPL
jgi:hypothetical protein